ncbi:hypothetical protein B0H13DRAFT_1920485 [Mycena leptocephala]|nr:hypothetical protein B0H13DRAFT_1920485 [Mycena leptocephala]
MMVQSKRQQDAQPNKVANLTGAKTAGMPSVLTGRHTRQRRIVDVGAHRLARKPVTQLVLTLFQMSVPSLDVMADEGQDPRDDISVDDESAGSPFRDTQDDDRRMLSLCQQLHDAHVCPPTPELTAHAGSDQLSRSPSLLAQYEPPIVGSHAPTPTYEPDTPPPLFLPLSDDEDDNEAPMSTDNAADTLPAHPRPRPPSPPRKRHRVQKSTNSEKILAHVKRFVDLEAQETDVEEDDDETDANMVGFIDDDPVDNEPVHHPEDVHRERWLHVPQSHRRGREQHEIRGVAVPLLQCTQP